MNRKVKSFLKGFVKVGISAGAIYFVFTKINPAGIWQIIQNISPDHLIISFLLYVLSKILSAFRLQLYFRNIGLIFPMLNQLRLYWLGMYYNVFLPGGIGGDGYKVYLLHQKSGMKTRKILTAVLLDRFNGLLVLWLLFLLFLIWPEETRRFSFLSILLAVFSILAWFSMLRIFFPEHRKNGSATVAYSFAVQGLQLLALFFLLVGFGQKEETISYFLIFLASSVIATLPVTIGGAGAREISFLYGARWLNLDISLAVSLSLLIYCISLISSFPGIIYSFKGIELNLYKKREGA